MVDVEKFLMHYGTKRHSGRYPYGSGENPYQHEEDFLNEIDRMYKSGMSESDVARYFGMTLSDYRIEVSIAKNELKVSKIANAQAMFSQGKTATEIGREMGVNESTVRGWLNTDISSKNQAKELAKTIKDISDKKGMLDVGKDAEIDLGVKRSQMDAALYYLRMEGYNVYSGRINNPLDPNKQTTQMILVPPGVEYKDIYNYDEVHSLSDYVVDNGKTGIEKLEYPASISSSRVAIRYADEPDANGYTGEQRDGLIELRPGVQDISLQGNHYAQVRILVDGDKYIKGMAVYNPNLPEGVDILVNSNKKDTGDKRDALKDISTADPDNPFGTLIRAKGQDHYIDENGEKQLGVVNIIRQENDWSDWSRDTSSQFLSKQTPKLVKQLTDVSYESKMAEYEEIMSLEIPAVKKQLLMEFARECDSTAVDLSAAALPRQQYHVILPYPELKENEIYAPNYKNGEHVSLVRYPHGGRFEIPYLVVNNNNKDIRSQIGDAPDAVGINPKVAAQLSGADFDGDTVLIIPDNTSTKVLHEPPLKGLANFNPKEYKMEKVTDDVYISKNGKLYTKDIPGKDLTKVDSDVFMDSKGHLQLEMKEGFKQKQMGIASNLITDMTIAGASSEEIERAVKYSMVVIDAKKHHLDYAKAREDFGIDELQRTYQQKVDENGNIIKYGGATTIISRASGEHTIDKTQGSGQINIKGTPWYNSSLPEGSLMYKTADNLYYAEQKTDKNSGIRTITTIDSNGKKGQVTFNYKNPTEYNFYKPTKVVDENGEVYFTNSDGTIRYSTKKRLEQTTNMAATSDAFTLVSRYNTEIERIYAQYANNLKSLANQARIDAYNTSYGNVDKEAKQRYSVEIEELKQLVNEAKSNSPKERQAQRIVSFKTSQFKEQHPEATSSEVRKFAQRTLEEARYQVGASRKAIVLTDRQWEAIRSGAVSGTFASELFNYIDDATLKERALPKGNQTSSAQQRRIKALNANGYTAQQIADSLGVSVSTVRRYLQQGSKGE